MSALVILMIEQEQPEGLSARKLVVETARHNVLTAYNAEVGMELLRRFPKVDVVLVHALIRGREDLIADIRRVVPEMPIIVASPRGDDSFERVNHVVPSHEPGALLQLLANVFGATTSN